MTQLEQLSERFVGVQGGVVDLMLMVRQARTGQRPMTLSDLQLMEQALFGISGELVLIPAELTEAVAETAAAKAKAMQDLARCQQLLEVYEAEAERNGLIPAIVNDRKFRTAELVPIGGNVVLMPDRLSRALNALNEMGDAS